MSRSRRGGNKTHKPKHNSGSSSSIDYRSFSDSSSNSRRKDSKQEGPKLDSHTSELKNKDVESQRIQRHYRRPSCLCRFFRWIMMCIQALYRGLRRQSWADLSRLVVLLIIFCGGTWMALEMLLKFVKPVFAQDTGSCGVVYVTVPGPIITVSIIGSSAPGSSARGTYYYSIVDGTTQWLNSQPPPTIKPSETLGSSVPPMVTPPVLGSGFPTTISNPSSPLLSPSESNPTLPPTITSSVPGEVTQPTLGPIITPSEPSVSSSTVLITPTTPSENPVLPSSTLGLPPSEPIQSSSSISPVPGTPVPPSGIHGPPPGLPTTTAVGESSYPGSPLPPSFSFRVSRSLGSSMTSLGETPTIPGLPPAGSSQLLLSSSLTPGVSSGEPTSITSSSELPSSPIVTDSQQPTITITSPRPSLSGSLSSPQTPAAPSLGLSNSGSLNSPIQSSTSGNSQSSTALLSSSSDISSALSSESPLGSSTPLSESSAPQSSDYLPSFSLFSSTLSSISTLSTPSGNAISSGPITPTFSTSPPSVSQNPTSSSPGPGSSGWNATTPTASCTSSGCSTGTHVLSYGDTAVTFEFPENTAMSADVSYWTGIYPTVTGREPLIVAPTIRAELTTQVSMLRPRTSATSTASGFTTVTVNRRATDASQGSCGEYGNFTLTWDDATPPAKNNTMELPPVTNPLHHLFFSNGFVYVPNKMQPYPAQSPPNVAMFLPIKALLPNRPFAGTLLKGELGAGPRASVDAYWFHAYSAYLGCANLSPFECKIQISGLRYDATTKQEVAVVKQSVSIPPCIAFVNCHLTQVTLDAGFRSLSGLQFEASILGLGAQIFFIDSVAMGWYNNSCSAGILRIGHR